MVEKIAFFIPRRGGFLASSDFHLLLMWKWFNCTINWNLGETEMEVKPFITWNICEKWNNTDFLLNFTTFHSSRGVLAFKYLGQHYNPLQNTIIILINPNTLHSHRKSYKPAKCIYAHYIGFIIYSDSLNILWLNVHYEK